MNRVSQFSSFIKNQFAPLGTAELETLLNSLPQAAVIINNNTNRIYLAKSKATELTAYTRSELTEVDYRSLFQVIKAEPDIEEGQIEPAKYPSPVELIKRGGSKSIVQVTFSPLGDANKFSLISFELDEQYRLLREEEERYHALWDHLNELSRALLSPNLDESLNSLLQTSLALTGACSLSIYQANSQNPSLQRITLTGSDPAFPDEISGQDFAHLQSPMIWVRGRRAIINLHRLAHASNITYMASAPIGEANAFIGLLIALGENSIPSPNLIPQLTFLATQVNTIIQGHALNTQLKQDIQDYMTKVLTNSAIFNSMEDGVIILSPDLIVNSLNPSAEICLGYATEEVAGQRIENVLIGGEDLKAAFQVVQNELRIGSIGSLKLFRRNGEYFQANLRIIPIINENQVNSIIILFHDLSEQEEYRLKNQQLEQRAMLGEVTASFAHEVKNPINNIFTGLQLLAINLPKDDPNQQNIARLEEDCERLTSLVKSSLTFVRPMEYKLEAIQLGQLISNLLERWRSRLVKLNIKYQVQADKTVPTIDGDYRALEQVFTNLINNAIEAMDTNGGMLSVKIRQISEDENQAHVEVSISDTGPGIPAELREKIFEPFFTPKQGGTGLGLAIVKRIVTAHRGSIYVNSILGGTNFVVQFPYTTSL
ncbi:MAG: PAS domain-containing protein [Anaerolineae bacterium]|nr:PAS domain-containing protein [Anaerolineae bacterium]